MSSHLEAAADRCRHAATWLPFGSDGHNALHVLAEFFRAAEQAHGCSLDSLCPDCEEDFQFCTAARAARALIKEA